MRRAMQGAWHGLWISAAMMAGEPMAEVRVATSQALAAAVERPQPEYNPVAKKMKVSGDVSVEVRIAKSGEVDQVKPVSGSPLLAAGVVKTVRQWKFKPFARDGEPAVAVTTLRFSFK